MTPAIQIKHDMFVKVSKRMPLTILGLVLPLVFVTPSLLLNYWDVSGFTLNYGGHVCFPTGFKCHVNE
jgi:hypothetical protein